MATIQVDIVSAEGEIHSGEAKMVFAPAEMGEVGSHRVTRRCCRR